MTTTWNKCYFTITLFLTTSGFVCSTSD